MDWNDIKRRKNLRQPPQKRKHLGEKLKQRVGATFRATRKAMGSQITQQVALQVIGNDTARAWRSQSHRLNEGGGSTDYRPRPGAASTVVAEDLAPLPPVAVSTSPSLRSATDPPPHSSHRLRSGAGNLPTKSARVRICCLDSRCVGVADVRQADAQIARADLTEVRPCCVSPGRIANGETTYSGKAN